MTTAWSLPLGTRRGRRWELATQSRRGAKADAVEAPAELRGGRMPSESLAHETAPRWRDGAELIGNDGFMIINYTVHECT